MPNKQDALALLNNILLEQDPVRQGILIKEFQNEIWDSSIEDPLHDILGEFAYDLDFYEPDMKLRNESPSYYGKDRLEQAITEAIEKIKQLP